MTGQLHSLGSSYPQKALAYIPSSCNMVVRLSLNNHWLHQVTHWVLMENSKILFDVSTFSQAFIGFLNDTEKVCQAPIWAYHQYFVDRNLGFCGIDDGKWQMRRINAQWVTSCNINLYKQINLTLIRVWNKNFTWEFIEVNKPWCQLIRFICLPQINSLFPHVGCFEAI